MIGWLLDIVRSLFFAIDSIVYKFVDTIYSLFLEIANTSIFSQEMIDEFAGKIYALVGIFMLFKVSFSLLTYIINPDEFADKSKGMGKLVKNIVTSLMLFILVPMIFREAMDIQRIILKDDIIPRIFSTNEITVSSQDPSMGSYMAVTTFQAFYQIEGNYDLEGIFKTDVNQKDSSDNYMVKYTYIISTVVGVILLLILVSFCFDIAVRSVKLGFLRLIAPVPIMTRIDPKKGSELFSKWVKTCVSTYLDLFMRLTAIFFAIYIIKAVGDIATGGGFVDAVTGEKIEVSIFVIVFLILGSLMFAKQLPKLIEDLFGIKLSGSFSLDPRKKLGEVPLVGGRLAQAATMATGAGLALGTGASHLLGGVLTRGLGAVVGAAGMEEYGRNLSNAGSRMMNNTRAEMARRMHYTRTEADARLAASGLGGGEFKGETAHQMYQKRRNEARSKRSQADFDITEQRALFDLGAASNRKNLDATSSEDDYREAGFRDAEFIESLRTIESNKVTLEARREALKKAQFVMDNADPSDKKAVDDAAEALANAEKEYEKAQKALSSSEDNHSRFIAPRHAEDAELEKARKIAKGSRP